MHKSPYSYLAALSLCAAAIGCSDKPEEDWVLVEGQKPGDCSDGADNDLNGLFDCDDDGCAGAPACAGDDDDSATGEEHNPWSDEGDDPGECADGADNDLDGLFDCADEGCAGAPACNGAGAGDDDDSATGEEHNPWSDEGDDPGECADGADNDLDGFFDCDDDGCVGAPACVGDDDDSASTQPEEAPEVIEVTSSNNELFFLYASNFYSVLIPTGSYHHQVDLGGSYSYPLEEATNGALQTYGADCLRVKYVPGTQSYVFFNPWGNGPLGEIQLDASRSNSLARLMGFSSVLSNEWPELLADTSSGGQLSFTFSSADALTRFLYLAADSDPQLTRFAIAALGSGFAGSADLINFRAGSWPNTADTWLYYNIFDYNSSMTLDSSPVLIASYNMSASSVTLLGNFQAFSTAAGAVELRSAMLMSPFAAATP